MLDDKFIRLEKPTEEQIKSSLGKSPHSDKLKIYDMWGIFQSGLPDASQSVRDTVFRDADRLCNHLRVLSKEQIPKFWRPVAINNDQGPVAVNRVRPSSQTKEYMPPLEQSNDQLDILKNLESNDCIIVQGPSGTGKTHTIGELCSLLLADLDFMDAHKSQRK